LRKRVPEVLGIPKPVARQVADAEISRDYPPEIAFRKALVASLEQAGRPDLDAGEPSLSALGHLIEEIDFAQAIRRLEVEANFYGLPTDKTVATLAPLVANHPYAEYLAAFRRDKSIREAGVAALEKKIASPELKFNQRTMLSWMYYTKRSPDSSRWYEVSRKHGDVIFSDLMRDINTGVAGKAGDQKSASYMSMLSKVSDKLPVVVALTIQRDWPHVEHEADHLERDYANEALVMKALADRYYGLKRYHDAERCARRLVEVHRGYPSYRLLAKVYKALGDDARWRQTLEQSLDLPSLGLEQAQIQNEIALYLLNRNQAKEAIVYADQAAQSYSGWSMITSARCHELLGDWEHSEELVRRCSARYEGSLADWMIWCHRTGHGDIQAADNFTRGKYAALGNSLYPGQELEFAHYFVLTNDPANAFPRYRRAFKAKREFYAAFHAALVADRLGKTADCDALLAEVIAAPIGKSEESGRDLYQKLAALFREMLPPKSARQLNFAEVDKILAAASKNGVSTATFPCFVGVFLKTRGDVEGAKKYLIRAAQSKDWQKFNTALACQLLREMKVAVPPVDNAATIEPPPPAMPRHKAG
jgi:tetratricopeptide (TPR) repeat protein